MHTRQPCKADILSRTDKVWSKEIHHISGQKTDKSLSETTSAYAYRATETWVSKASQSFYLHPFQKQEAIQAPVLKICRQTLLWCWHMYSSLLSHSSCTSCCLLHTQLFGALDLHLSSPSSQLTSSALTCHAALMKLVFACKHSRVDVIPEHS